MQCNQGKQLVRCAKYSLGLLYIRRFQKVPINLGAQALETEARSRVLEPKRNRKGVEDFCRCFKPAEFSSNFANLQQSHLADLTY